MGQDDKVIGRFQKNVQSSIQVTLVPWQGDDYLDVREVVPSGEGFTYTKKGIRIRAELAQELIDLLNQAETETQETHGEGGQTLAEDIR